MPSDGGGVASHARVAHASSQTKRQALMMPPNSQPGGSHSTPPAPEPTSLSTPDDATTTSRFGASTQTQPATQGVTTFAEPKSKLWGFITPSPLLKIHSAAMRTGETCLLGRSSACALRVEEHTVSSKHCLVEYDEKVELACITDLKSSNGTWLNGFRLEPFKKSYLAHGDVFSLVGAAEPPRRLRAPPASPEPPAPAPSGPAFAFTFTYVSHMQSASAQDCARRVPELNARFALLNELGKGSFATVFRAADRATGELVAVKVVERARLQNVSQSKWLDQVRESETLSKLNHPYIVKFKEALAGHDSLCVVTELLRGGELFDRLLKAPYPEAKGRILTRRLFEAVAYLHDQGFVHRDLKPENIVIVSKDNDLDVKIVDFGVAADVLSGCKTFCGSLSYIAPEVLRRRGTSGAKHGKYGRSADVWSLGVIVHVILSQHPPFDQDQFSQMHTALTDVIRFEGAEWEAVSPEAKAFIAACLELDDNKRMTAKSALQHPWIKDCLG